MSFLQSPLPMAYTFPPSEGNPTNLHGHWCVYGCLPMHRNTMYVQLHMYVHIILLLV